MFTNRKVLPVVFVVLLVPMQVRAWWNPVDLFKKSPTLTSIGLIGAVAAASVAIYNLCSGSDQKKTKPQYNYQLFKKAHEQQFIDAQSAADKTNKKVRKTFDIVSSKISLLSKPTMVGKSKDLISQNAQTMKLFVVIKGSKFKYCVAFPAKYPTEKKRWDITMYGSIFGAVAKVLVNQKFSSEQEKSAFKKELIKFYKDNSNIEKLIK